MLKPFQIRDLQEADPPAAASDRPRGVVQISVPEYDETISKVPDATLTYLDDDDGETITVGSSLELAQRLDESTMMAHKRASRRAVPSIPLPALNRLSNPQLSHSAPPMHVFDIQQSSVALDVWRGFEKRTRNALEQQANIETALTGTQSINTLSKTHQTQEDAFKELKRKHEQPSERVQWLQACNPPQVPSKASSQDIYKPFALQGSSENGPPHQLGSPTTTRLTLEGQRQAKEAGARFIHGKKSGFADSHTPAELLRTTHENRWASYKDRTSADEKRYSTIATHESLLEAFEKEMARRLEPQPSRDISAKLAAPNPPIRQPPEVAIPTITRSQEQPNETYTTGVSSPSSAPGDIVAQTIQALVTGVGQLGAELRSNFPDVERTLIEAHRKIPEAVEDTMRGALRGFGEHVQTLATSMQEASDAARNAAERSREADLSAIENVFDGLKGFVGEIGNVGRTLFSAFEAELSGASVTASSQPAPNPPPRLSPIHVVAEVPTESTSSPDASKLTSASLSSSHFVPLKQGNVKSDEASICVPGCVIARRRNHINCVVRDLRPSSLSGYRAVPRPRSGRSRSPPASRDWEPLSRQEIDPIQTQQPAPRPEQRPSTFHPKSTKDDQRLSILKPTSDRQIWKPHLWSKSSTPAMNHRSTVTFADDAEKTRRCESPKIPRRHKSLDALTSLSLQSTGSDANIGKEGPSEPPFARFDITQLGDDFQPPRSLRQWDEPLHNRRDSTESREKLEKAYAPTAILDQEDPDPEFSARYPSLLSSNPVRRANTIGGTAHNPSFSLNLNPESEIARYPTMQQFEQGRRHPDLAPAMETSSQNSTTVSAAESARTLPGAWPSAEADIPAQESSGEFFNRMTGLNRPNTSKNGLHRSNTVTEADPAARLSGPWDPLADLATTTAEHRDESLHRSRTERASRRQFHGSRRPYSERFSGHGRMPWESFIASSRTPGAYPSEEVLPTQEPQVHFPYPRPGLRRPTAHRPFLPPLTIPPPRAANPVPASRPPPSQPKSKIETCINHLRNLGYAPQVRGGMERLKVYAEATNGDLVEAIEMIEEERKAYEGRGVGISSTTN